VSSFVDRFSSIRACKGETASGAVERSYVGELWRLEDFDIAVAVVANSVGIEKMSKDVRLRTTGQKD
jgi:hypothetical protein